MVSNFYLWVYRVWCYILLPFTYIFFLKGYKIFSSIEYFGLLGSLFILLFVLTNYLTVLKNRIAYWLNFLTMILFCGGIIMELPKFMVYEIREFSLNYFSSYGSIERFAEILGVITLLFLWYLWTGVGPIFNTYSRFTLDKMQVNMPDFLKNPIVISSVIFILGLIVAIYYYRYSDPLNECQRTLKEKNPQTSEILIMRQCHKIVNGK